jgi:hypothetical protein
MYMCHLRHIRSLLLSLFSTLSDRIMGRKDTGHEPKPPSMGRGYLLAQADPSPRGQENTVGREGLSLVPITQYRPDRAVASTGKWEYGAGAKAIARMNCASCTTCCRPGPIAAAHPRLGTGGWAPGSPGDRRPGKNASFGRVLFILLDCTVAQWSGSWRQRPRLPCARSRPVWMFVWLAPERFATFSCRSGAPGSG